VVIPPGSHATRRAAPAPVQALVDGADAKTASIAINLRQRDRSPRIGARGAAGRRARAAIVAQPRVWYNEALVSAVMIVPASSR